jgi:hypothetical protein
LKSTVYFQRPYRQSVAVWKRYFWGTGRPSGRGAHTRGRASDPRSGRVVWTRCTTWLITFSECLRYKLKRNVMNLWITEGMSLPRRWTRRHSALKTFRSISFRSLIMRFGN